KSQSFLRKFFLSKWNAVLQFSSYQQNFIPIIRKRIAYAMHSLIVSEIIDDSENDARHLGQRKRRKLLLSYRFSHLTSFIRLLYSSTTFFITICASTFICSKYTPAGNPLRLRITV